MTSSPPLLLPAFGKGAIDRIRQARHTSGTLKNSFLILSLFVASAAFVQAQTAPPSISRENKALIQASLVDFDAKKYDLALQKLQTVEKSLPGDPFILNLLGAAYTKKKDYATAQGYFEQALSKQPDFFPAKFNLGELLFLQRRYAEALQYFGNMQQMDPRNELLQFKIFLCELQLGDKDAATAILKTIKYPSDTPAWYYAQAAWESKNGNNKKALEYVIGAKNIFGLKTALFDETFEDLGIKLH